MADKKMGKWEGRMNRLKEEVWFLASKKIAEERKLMTQIEYVAFILNTSEKTVQRRFEDLAFTSDDWKILFNKFGEKVFEAFQETIRQGK